MFLVTTANQNYWKKDEKILFLGEWCKIYDQKHIWSNLDHETLPSHWDEIEDLDRHCKYLECLYEKYLKNLASSLNDSHNEDFHLRYWRILLGPWLSYFVGIIYDRYLSINSAIESKKITHTWIPPLKPTPWTPLDTNTFLVSACSNDNFNLYLYSQIMTKIGRISFEHKEDESFFGELNDTEGDSLSLSKKFFFSIKDFLIKISRRIPDRFNQIVFSSSGLSFWNQVRLQISLGQIPYLASRNIIYSQISTNEDLRKKIKLPRATNEFESILNDLIIEQLPTPFLENYSFIRKKSLDAFPKNPKVIFTAYDFALNEGFKFWAATQIERGAKLILAQHGGGYGMAGPLEQQSRELEICDKYFTWGWKLKSQPKTVPMAGGKLQDAQYNIKSDPNGTILWVAVSWQPFFVRIDHITTGFHGPKYFLRQACFLDTISPEVFKLLLMRRPPMECSGEGERFNKIYPSLKIYQGSTTLPKQLQNSRLCVHDYLGTTWLETLSMNFPTVVFWDPTRVKIAESAQPYLDDLRRVKILHDTPESAANLINEIYEDPLTWWMSPERQKEREKFCYQFTRKSENWLEEWKDELLKSVS